MNLNLTVTRPHYVRVKTSLEIYGMDRRSHHEDEGVGFDSDVTYLPDVWRHNPAVTKLKPDFVFMTEDIQHWIFRMNVERAIGRRFTSDLEYKTFWQADLARFKKKDPTQPGTFIVWWNRLFTGDRSHTNFAGMETCRNFIGDANFDGSLPKFSNVVTGDFVGELADPTQTKYLYGATCRPLKCIDISKGDYRKYSCFTHPELFDQPTVSGRDMVLEKSGWRKTAYWMRTFYNFNVKVVLPFMLPQDDITWMPASDLQVGGGTPLNKPFGQYKITPL